MHKHVSLGLRLVLVAAIAYLLQSLLLPDADAAGGTGMLLAYAVLTNSDVNKIWRKAQGKLATGFNFVTPEFRWVNDFKELEIDASLREMTFPIDLHEDRGITMLPEGGREAEPMSVNAEDATVTFVHANGRFTVSKLARWAGQADGGRGMIERQIRFQGLHKVRAMGRVIGDQFYGFSTGVLAMVDDGNGSLTSGASHTIPLKNAYGSSSIPGTTAAQKAFIADKFKVGDQVALVNPGGGTLVTNAIGKVTGVNPATPSITVTWIPGNVDPSDGDYVVLANGANASTLDHTSYNRCLVGLLEMMTAASVHGIATATVPNWSAAYSDTSSGRFDGVKYRKAVDEIRNYGDEDAEVQTLMAQGVYRDVVAQYSAAVQFADPMRLEIDGDARAGGKRIRGTRRVPPGFVFLFDSGRAIRKKALLEQPRQGPMWADGKELIDDSGWIFAIDWPLLLATQNRKLLAYFANQSES